MKSIDTQQLSDAMEKNKKVVVINVLPSDSFEEEHIPGSINIPLEDGNFVDKVKNKVKDKNTPIIVYCASEECPASGEAGEKLEKEGYKNVMHFGGGMEAWKNEGMEVESSV